jgi:hypothetical protein
MTNFKNYLQKILPKNITSFSPIKSLFTNLINNLGGKQITINLLRKKMPESLRVILAVRKELKNKLRKAVEKDIGITTVTKENIDDLYNDKINYNEGASFHGFMMTLPVIWFIFIFLLIFGEEQHRKIMDFITEKGDKALSRMGLNSFNDIDDNK